MFPSHSPPGNRRDAPCTRPDDDVIVGYVYYVYMLRCADGTLYTGSTTDVHSRERKHNAGMGAKYTAARRPVRVVYSEVHESRSTAQKREALLKRWRRPKKEALVAGDTRQLPLRGEASRLTLDPTQEQ